MFRFLILCLLILSPLAVYSAPSGNDAIRSTFIFIDRGNLDAALAIAKNSKNTVLGKYVLWLYLRDKDTDPSFEELSEFIRKNPDWPDQDRLIRRAEAALLASSPTPDKLKAWFDTYPPQSKKGLMSSTKSSGHDVSTIIKSVWIDGDFNEAEESRLLREYGKGLTQSDHFSRASRLVWDEEYFAARRMQKLLSAPQRDVITARISLKTEAKTAKRDVQAVSGEYNNDAGFLFDRLRWRAKRDQEEGVKEILLIAPKTVPYPEKWWKYRERYIREAVEDKNYKLARRLLKNHGQTEGAELIDALFLSGWLALEFEKNAHDAYKEFYALYDEAKFPHSKSRAAYWAGRAAEKNNNKDIARGWYEKGAKNPTTYYGQLSSHELGQYTELSLPSTITPTASENASYQRGEIPQVIKMLASLGEDDRALRFIQSQAEKADSKQKAALVAQLALDIRRPDYSVKAAKKSLQNDILLVNYAYPIVRPNFESTLEKAVILALTRQESEFNPMAKSPANAMGYMQLLPTTAKEVAKKAGITYSRNRLFEPQYNMQLGSMYYNRLVSKFDGSYIMAAAGYNAGPGRVSQWVKRFGYPGANYRQAINWIEMIPFDETRNYVQRVLENTQVYRHLLAVDGKKPKLQIAKDLAR